LFIPPIIIPVVSYCLTKSETKQKKYFSQIVSNVDAFVEAFRAIPDDLIYDEVYLEKFILEKAGLNNEFLWHYPTELKQYCGKGLLIWQSPKQFSKYMIWLLKNAKNYASYLEIGCRWGGTFIVTCEVLCRANPKFKYAIACDLMEKTPFIERYMEICKDSGFEIIYFQGSSISEEFTHLIKEKKPEISFIDGDHKMFGVLQDHILVREHSSVIVHHDITSDTCDDVTLLWNSFKKLEKDMNAVEFTEQYPEIRGKYFGIGVLYKK
jgi:hypothetical protein